jgi:FkbM family methyltransferase
MKKIVKKSIHLFIKTALIFNGSKSRTAKLHTFFSKLLYHKKNNIEYDEQLDVYWLKENDRYLFAVTYPYFNYSKKNLYSFIDTVYCKDYKPNKGDLVIDLGAGVGTETLFLYEHVGPEGIIYSIEASPDSYRKLNALCLRNRITNSVNCNVAISNFTGKIWIEETEKFEVNQVNLEKKGLEVDSLTLDQFVIDNKISKIDFLKVNIEGAELQMIDGMKNSIDKVENIAVSCHDFLFAEDRQIMKKTVDFLKKNGFEISFNNSGNKVVDSWLYGRKK